jgi:predicted RNase H-like HicB family nuclease
VSDDPTMAIQQDGEWWIGWIDGMPGVNSQGRTREELVENLCSAREEWRQLSKEDGDANPD